MQDKHYLHQININILMRIDKSSLLINKQINVIFTFEKI